MNVVLDTGVILKTIFLEEHSDKATRIIDETITLRWAIVAPPIMLAGVTNAIRRRMQREKRSLTEALTWLEVILQYPVTTADTPALYRRALTFTERYSLSAYDALYLALAEALSCDLWTSDERVLRALAGREPRVRWIGTFVTLDQQQDTH